MSEYISPFHLAFPVRDLDETRAFYLGVLGCSEGRSSDSWTDFSLFGHQMSAHLGTRPAASASGIVDGIEVPIPHFGVVLSMKDWDALACRLTAADDIDWVIRPTKRFEGQPGEQATLFVKDPSGNALEFKGFADPSKVFAT
ncbi:MAG: VOC family protein [Pseudomonadota bacterium]